MPSIDDIPVVESAVHLLAVADSKMGKSVYTAQAAVDGMQLAYFDNDNGLSAIRYLIDQQPEGKRAEIKANLEYYPVLHPSTFYMNLLRSNAIAPFNWVPRIGKGWGKLLVDIRPDDVVWCFDVTKFPKTWIMGIDGWTSTAADALGIGAADQKATLLEGTDQSIYGDANARLTYIVNLLQRAPFHVILQAHGTFYERYEKPKGSTGIVQQKSLVLQETLEVPISSSRPHGKEMANRFNHIGWMSVDGVGETTIDFTRKLGRIGGGPPNKIALARNLPFSKLVSRIPERVEAPGWFHQTTHEELVGATGKTTLQIPTAVGSISAQSVPAVPAIVAAPKVESKFDLAAFKANTAK